jgi:uracil-DNA glycosylase
LNSEDVLQQVAIEVAVCEKCALHFSRKKSVPGEGPANAEILLIGEGPGFYENEQGRPFVGPSGQFLDELLQKAGYKRANVFIGNVVKCRPPSNRDPLPDELAACRPYLERQIEAINPRIIVTLGRYSMGHFLPNARISQVHGRSFTVNGRMIIPMYHPAAALHQPALRSDIVADFTNLPKLIATAKQPPEPKPAPQPVVQPDLLMQPPLIEKAVEPPKPEKENKGEDDKPVQLSLF